MEHPAMPIFLFENLYLTKKTTQQTLQSVERSFCFQLVLYQDNGQFFFRNPEDVT